MFDMQPGLALEFVQDVVRGALNADSFTYWLTGGLAFAIFLIMRAMLPAKGLATLYLPFVAFGGLLGPSLLGRLNIYLLVDRPSNILASITSGMVVTVLLLVVLTRFAFSIAAVVETVPSPETRSIPTRRRF